MDRTGPLIVLMDSLIVLQLSSTILSTWAKVLQATLNRRMHTKVGNTTFITLEDLIPASTQRTTINLESSLFPQTFNHYDKHLLLSYRSPQTRPPDYSLPILSQRPKFRTGQRKSNLSLTGEKMYYKTRLLRRINGLRPNAKPAFFKRSSSLGNWPQNSIIRFQRDIDLPAPPPGGAPGASANEECKPLSSSNACTEGKGPRGRRQRRREYRAWRRALTVPIRLHRLGKGVANGRAPLNAATKRSTGMKASHIFKRMCAQSRTKGPQRANNRDPSTAALATPLQSYGKELKIGTQNVQGMAEILKHQYVLNIMKEHSLDILVLTET